MCIMFLLVLFMLPSATALLEIIVGSGDVRRIDSAGVAGELGWYCTILDEKFCVSVLSRSPSVGGAVVKHAVVALLVMR